MPDRDAFLRRVDGQLPLVAEQRAAVLEELRGHLHDSVAGLIDDGWDPTGAEEEALRRIGDPEELAREIGHAQQTRRRLLAAAGSEVFDQGLSMVASWVLMILEWSPTSQPPRFKGTILEWLLADRSPRPIAAS